MEELTESARQSLVSQGIVVGTLSLLTSLGLLLTGIIVVIRANDILRFTSLTHLAVLEIVCGMTSLLIVAYIWWTVAGYRSRQLEIRSKYLDENMIRGLIALIFPLFITFSAFVVSAVFMLLKTESSSTYELKSAMSLYSTDVTRKVIMDKLQTSLECCGSQSLLDWFLVDWQNADVEPGVHMPNKTTTDWDSVPYSCCCPESPPPCIHHQLKIFGVGSLYTTGCADKLDEVVFVYVVVSSILFFASTFLMILLIYIARKLQTSSRSAIQKGDATAPGAWWIISPYSAFHTGCHVISDITPLIDRKHARCVPECEDPCSIPDYCHRHNNVIMSPCMVNHNSKIIDSSLNCEEEWVPKTERKVEEESSEDWTRMACDASGTTSTTSFVTSSGNMNSTPESRRSISDTAVANLEVSHPFEHKIRPLYRT